MPTPWSLRWIQWLRLHRLPEQAGKGPCVGVPVLRKPPFHAHRLLGCVASPQCYLCKVPGHTTQTCPHRILPSEGKNAGDSGSRQAGAAVKSLVRLAMMRQTSPQLPTISNKLKSLGSSQLPEKWHVSAAITKVHTRRISCLAFHANKPDLLISGDKVHARCLLD